MTRRTMRVGIRDHFDSMHLLPGHPKCGVPHGHTYTVEVAVQGPVVNGMVIDFGLLKQRVRALLKDFDHTDLNKLMPVPSCENLAAELLRRLKPALGARKRVTIRIWEGDGKWAELDG